VAERGADDIQREIESARVKLAGAVDQIAYRTSPKRVSDSIRDTLKEKARSTQGRIVIGVSGGLVVVLVIRRIRRRS
jgi:osmotically-inducible protein OsmY